MRVAKSTDEFVLVVRNTADASMDYYLPKWRADELRLPTIYVYNVGSERYDPNSIAFHERWR